jgi:hypothetical protein
LLTLFQTHTPPQQSQRRRIWSCCGSRWLPDLVEVRAPILPILSTQLTNLGLRSSGISPVAVGQITSPSKSSRRPHCHIMYPSLPYRTQPLSPTFGPPTARAKCASKCHPSNTTNILIFGTVFAKKILSSSASLPNLSTRAVMLLTARLSSLRYDQSTDHPARSHIRSPRSSSSAEGLVFFYEEHILWLGTRGTLLKFVSRAPVVPRTNGSVTEKNIPNHF